MIRRERAVLNMWCAAAFMMIILAVVIGRAAPVGGCPAPAPAASQPDPLLDWHGAKAHKRSDI